MRTRVCYVDCSEAVLLPFVTCSLNLPRIKQQRCAERVDPCTNGSSLGWDTGEGEDSRFFSAPAGKRDDDVRSQATTVCCHSLSY
jgi:hypothetical protein